MEGNLEMSGSKLWVPLGDARELLVDANLLRLGSGPLPSSMSPLTLTYVVDASFGAPTPNGSAGAPFPTVTAGIAALVAAGATGGTLIVVGAVYDGEADITIGPGEWGLIAWSPVGGNPAPVTLPRLILDGTLGTVTLGIERCNFVAGVENLAGTNAVRTFQSSGEFVETGGLLTIECYGGAPGTLQPTITGVAFAAELFGVDAIDLTGHSAGGPWTFEHCACSGTLTNNGTAGGAHQNERWTFRDCRFADGCALVAGQPGASFDVYMDQSSINELWRAGPTLTGNVQFYEESLVQLFSARATDATATATTSGDENWHAITGGTFTPDQGGTPWVLQLTECQAEYQAAYIGLGTPPATPRQWCKVQVHASISTAGAVAIAMAIDFDGDLVGQPIGFTGGAQHVTTPAAAGLIQVCAQRVISLAAATVQTVQPVFGCPAVISKQDVAIQNLDMTIEPFGSVAGAY
jgi:hypothetical protein